MRTIATLSGIVGCLVSLTARADCPPGQSVGPDTAGQCCWPGQVWSASRSVCVGVPQCPSGWQADGERCVAAGCPAGQASGPDTAGHCCWPGQVWSASRNVCVGIPQCGPGFTVSGESCVAAPATGGAPPPTATPPAPVAAPVAPAPVVPSVAPPPMPPLGTVPVTFVAKAEALGHLYRVTVGPASCTTPCTLNVPPGNVHLVVESQRVAAGRFQTDVQVPPTPSLVRMHYTGINGYIMGGVAIGLGVPATIACAWLLTQYDGRIINNAVNNDYLLFGAIGVALGSALVITGAIEIALANRHTVDVQMTGPPMHAKAPRPRLTFGAAPTARGTGGAASLAVTF